MNIQAMMKQAQALQKDMLSLCFCARFWWCCSPPLNIKRKGFEKRILVAINCLWLSWCRYIYLPSSIGMATIKYSNGFWFTPMHGVWLPCCSLFFIWCPGINSLLGLTMSGPDFWASSCWELALSQFPMLCWYMWSRNCCKKSIQYGTYCISLWQVFVCCSFSKQERILQQLL